MNDTESCGSPLLAPIFSSAAMRRIFSDRALIQAMLDFEAALARAEAEVGTIPAEAADAIAAACDAQLYDIVEIGAAAANAGNVAIPLVEALTQRVSQDARGFVHWGATSQDVIDTAMMLLARDALAAMRRDLRAAAAALINLIERHRGTLMPGRTLLQQALPITFAFKAAGWLSGVTRAARRLRQIEGESLALQFGGATGTLAALAGEGLAVRRALAAQLALGEAPIGWHAERQRVADIAFGIAALSGACAKIATDVLLLMQTEIAEASEPAAAGKGGSSTMPHKRNPVGAAAIRANHRRIAGLVTTIVVCLEAEHERAPGAWAAEWETLRGLFCLSAGSLERLHDMLAGLQVDAARMRANLDSALGLPLAESLMMALAPSVGRMQAHRLVEALSKRALADGRSLLEIAGHDPAITAILAPDAIAQALQPENYLGSADAMIDGALLKARREMEMG